ncbi:mitochondrial inner membrane protein OXA1L isoform X4 [Gopherus flavomarginatus]|uniref:mitochondrial inner membrane protein OXA1L isoform X4 n=1 Tax=Gopherus flavomarginatus TaxID=286002 RepID=UPI0021CC38BD|nr:mitochondrial inner membrane protein OXA1L isoform X4 [Gopherus flavomarginatus]
MAASAAARRGWRRLGPPELAPLLRGLHTQIRRGPAPPAWLHGNAPRGAPLRPRLPPARSQSSAAQVLPPAAAPAPDLGGAVPGGELAEVPELGLAELGLGSYTPVGLIQNLLEFLHTDLGLPWWGAIMAGTVAARCLVFPLIVKGQREAAKLNNHLPEITRLTQCMQDAKRSGNQFEFSKSYSELSLYQKAHDVNPMRGFLVPLVQAPIFISFFIALREMAALPVPSMQSGGLAWFVDLTVADPLYVLPLVVTGTMWLILELGAESGVDNPNLKVMKTVFRVMPLVILPLTISFPTAGRTPSWPSSCRNVSGGSRTTWPWPQKDPCARPSPTTPCSRRRAELAALAPAPAGRGPGRTRWAETRDPGTTSRGGPRPPHPRTLLRVVCLSQ